MTGRDLELYLMRRLVEEHKRRKYWYGQWRKLDGDMRDLRRGHSLTDFLDVPVRLAVVNDKGEFVKWIGQKGG